MQGFCCLELLITCIVLMKCQPSQQADELRKESLVQIPAVMNRLYQEWSKERMVNKIARSIDARVERKKSSYVISGDLPKPKNCTLLKAELWMEFYEAKNPAFVAKTKFSADIHLSYRNRRRVVNNMSEKSVLERDHVELCFNITELYLKLQDSSKREFQFSIRLYELLKDEENVKADVRHVTVASMLKGKVKAYVLIFEPHEVMKNDLLTISGIMKRSWRWSRSLVESSSTEISNVSTDMEESSEASLPKSDWGTADHQMLLHHPTSKASRKVSDVSEIDLVKSALSSANWLTATQAMSPDHEAFTESPGAVWSKATQDPLTIQEEMVPALASANTDLVKEESIKSVPPRGGWKTGMQHLSFDEEKLTKSQQPGTKWKAEELDSSTHSGNSTKFRRTRVYRAHKRRKRVCGLKKWFVNFHKMGWDRFVIQPSRGYMANRCAGMCPFVLPDYLNVSNHAIIQNIAHHLLGKPNGACCVPKDLAPLTMIYEDADRLISIIHQPNMIAESCACL